MAHVPYTAGDWNVSVTSSHHIKPRANLPNVRQVVEIVAPTATRHAQSQPPSLRTENIGLGTVRIGQRGRGKNSSQAL